MKARNETDSCSTQVPASTASSRFVIVIPAILTRSLTISTPTQSFSTACLQNSDCQSEILNVDSTSKIHVYSLQTVGTTYQVSMNQVGIINQNQNRNGFASTVTFWKSI